MYYSVEVNFRRRSVNLRFNTLTVLFWLSVCLFFLFKAIVDMCAYNIWAIINHTGKYSFCQLPYYVM